MKTLLVTSRITFVPDNYDTLVVGMVECPQVAGLLVLDNFSPALLTRSLAIGVIGARRIAGSLITNTFSRSTSRRLKAYKAAGKPVWTASGINEPAVLDIIQDEKIDLVINARTRDIYGPEILNAPRLGCVNIHHGLLPDQRGTMCDLWSLYNSRPTGFSIHQMTEKIDRGDILKAVQTSDGKEKDYMAYLRHSTSREVEELSALLAELEETDSLKGRANKKTKAGAFHKDPTPAQIREIAKSEMLV